MRHFVWIVDGNLFPYIKGEGGVSASYIVPRAQSTERMDHLAAATLWVILRRNEVDVLFASLFVKRVEQFEDGYNAGDYLLIVDQAKSYRAISDISLSGNRFLSETNALGTGISAIKEDIAASISSSVLQNIAITFRKPPDSTLEKINAPSILGAPETVARRYIVAVSSRFSLQDVWATRSPFALSPFAHFAYLKIARDYGQDKADALALNLNIFDPSANRSASIEHQNVDGDHNKISPLSRPVVDVDLLPIDTNKLYARKFIAREPSSINLDEIMEKIEHAEKRHQDMLRDIASYLTSKKITPLQSSSIDLSVERDAKLTIFELKSSHSANVLAQSAKGAFQLFCYRSALIDDERDVSNIVLVLERTLSLELDEYVARILEGIGVVVLFYDCKQDWPNRLTGLDELLASGN